MFDINDWRSILFLFLSLSESSNFRIVTKLSKLSLIMKSSRDNFLDFDFGTLLFNVWEIPGTHLPTSLSRWVYKLNWKVKIQFITFCESKWRWSANFLCSSLWLPFRLPHRHGIVKAELLAEATLDRDNSHIKFRWDPTQMLTFVEETS